MRLPFVNDGTVRLDLSSDGTHAIASWREAERERCVWSGRELPTVAWERGRAPERVWSADTTRRVAIERVSSAVRVVVSDAQRDVWSAPLEDARVTRLGVRRGDDCLAFRAKRNGAWWIDREGEEAVGPFDEISSLEWHADQLVAVVRVGEAWSVWIEGRLVPCSTGRPGIRVRHGAFAFVDGAGRSFFLQHGERRLGPFPVRPSIELGRDDQIVIALQHDRSRSEVALADGTQVGTFTRLRSLERCTGPRGDRLVFAYDQENYAGMFVDGQRHDGLGYSDGPWWSSDGAHLFWAAEGARGETFGVLDGRERVYPRTIDWEMGSSMRVLNRGEACAFTIDHAASHTSVHIGARSLGPFAHLVPSARRDDFEVVALSRDEEHLALQHVDDGHAYVCVDDEELGPLPRATTFTMTEREVVIASLDDDATDVVVVRRALV